MKDVIHSGSHGKLFAGFMLTSELKMHLNESKTWKSAKSIPTNDTDDLIETRYGKHHYVGLFLPEKLLPLGALKDYEKKIGQKLQHYCPQLDSIKMKFCVFSQLFVQ